jgi:CRP-like cAMP-binding protein
VSEATANGEIARIETVLFLQHVDLFSFCKAEEILRIAAIGKQRRFSENERIFKLNDPADVLYCVIQGGLSLVGPDGDKKLVGPTQTCGVVEILSGRLRTADAIATADTLVLAIEADDFFDLLAHNIEIVKALFRHVIQQIQQTG